jgi:hypothetical protein
VAKAIAYLQLPPEHRIWNQLLEQALRPCGTPILAKGAGEGILSSAEKFIIVLALEARWW